jgi:subtilisin family serine protease
MKVIVKDFLNVRVGAPSVNAPCYQYIAPGSELEVDGVLYTGDFFENSNKWMKDIAGNYYWAGGLKEIPPKKEDLPSFFFNYNSLFKNIPQTTRDTKGKDINVAILDSGVDEHHPDLSAAFAQKNSVDCTGSSIGARDTFGHGTHVTGLIGARSDDNIGIVGIAPACNMRNIKVLDDEGNSSAAALIKGLQKAKGIPVDIINLSLSISFKEYKNIVDAFNNLVKDTVAVVAAGNDDTLLKTDMLLPAMSAEVISVGAVSADFVKRNPSPSFNKRLDYMLPEIKLMSCWPTEKNLFAEDHGSSMATALVTGLIALIMKETNNKNKAHIKQVLDGIAVKYNPQLDFNTITLIKPI